MFKTRVQQLSTLLGIYHIYSGKSSRELLFQKISWEDVEEFGMPGWARVTQSIFLTLWNRIDQRDREAVFRSVIFFHIRRRSRVCTWGHPWYKSSEEWNVYLKAWANFYAKKSIGEPIHGILKVLLKTIPWSNFLLYYEGCHDVDIDEPLSLGLEV